MYVVSVFWKSNLFAAILWPLGAEVWALGGGLLLQRRDGAMEEEAAASQQFLLHGWQAAPLLTKPQHLHKDTTPHFIFNLEWNPHHWRFHLHHSGWWSRDHDSSLRWKTYLSASIQKWTWKTNNLNSRRMHAWPTHTHTHTNRLSVCLNRIHQMCWKPYILNIFSQVKNSKKSRLQNEKWDIKHQTGQ